MLLTLLQVQGGSHNKPLSSQTVSGAEVEKPCMQARKRAVLLVEEQNLANNRDLVTETEFQNIQLIQS